MTKGPTLPKMTLEDQQRKQPKTPTVYPTEDGRRHDPRDFKQIRNNKRSAIQVRRRQKPPSHGGARISYARHAPHSML